MKIYTSFFDNWRTLKPLNIVIVSVTNRKPVGFTDMPVLSSLAPNTACKEAPKGKFLETYWREILDKCNPYLIYNFLRIISQRNYDADIALCDFCKPSDFNYRRQIAAWLQNKLQIRIPEFPVCISPEGFKIQEEEDKDDLKMKEEIRQAIIQKQLTENNYQPLPPIPYNKRWPK